MNIDISPIIQEVKYQIRKLRYEPWKSPYIESIDAITKKIIDSRRTYGYSCDISPKNVKDTLYELILKHGVSITESEANRYDNHMDLIEIMPFELFKNFDIYQTVILHELSHWTRTSTRTNRDSRHDNTYDHNTLYNVEECIAELSCILLQKTLIKSTDLSLTSNSIQYINHYCYGIFNADRCVEKTKLVNKTIIPMAIEASNFILAPLNIKLEY